jgi:hypothetical protein
MIGLTLFSIYIISVLRMRRWVRISYSEQGRWPCGDIDGSDIGATFIPLLNTICAILSTWHSPYSEKYRKDNGSKIINKIYGIK